MQDKHAGTCEFAVFVLSHSPVHGNIAATHLDLTLTYGGTRTCLRLELNEGEPSWTLVLIKRHVDIFDLAMFLKTGLDLFLGADFERNVPHDETKTLLGPIARMVDWLERLVVPCLLRSAIKLILQERFPQILF